MQTIPGLALLALFYPLLLGIAALTERTFGAGFSALGFLPSVLALALYSMLPVLRNTITGLDGVDADVKQAALGVGMTRRQSLFMVELPLALPVIMAGIRTAAVWVIGTATLSTPIGQTSLGNYIFTGLQTQNWVFVLFGCAAAAVLALAVDQLLALMERGLGAQNRKRVAAGALGLLLIALASLAPGLSRPAATYVIGTKPFTEQYILAALIEMRLREAGTDRAAARGTRLRRSSSKRCAPAKSMSMSIIPAPSGATSSSAPTSSRALDMLAEIRADLQNRYAHQDHGSRWASRTPTRWRWRQAARSRSASARIADLASRAPQLSIAGDYEFFGRPEWQALRDAYGLKFREERQMQPEFMYPAVAAGEVDVIAAYTSDGRIAHHDLAVLDDPKRAIPPYDAFLLIAPKRFGDQALLNALQPLIGAINVTMMREANLRAAGSDGASPEQAARWLWSEIEKKAKR